MSKAPPASRTLRSWRGGSVESSVADGLLIEADASETVVALGRHRRTVGRESGSTRSSSPASQRSSSSLSTVLHEADVDYRLVVVEGLCAGGGDGDAPKVAAFRNTPA